MKPAVFALFSSVVFLMASAVFAGTGEGTATYSVPVRSSLREYATFELQGLAYEESGADVKVSYEMPVGLVGREGVIVSFVGRSDGAGKTVLTGDFGTGTCSESEEEVGPHEICQVQYENLEIDANGVTDYLMATAKSSEEFLARQSVAALFAHEPIGVVRYFSSEK